MTKVEEKIESIEGKAKNRKYLYAFVIVLVLILVAYFFGFFGGKENVSNTGSKKAYTLFFKYYSSFPKDAYFYKYKESFGPLSSISNTVEVLKLSNVSYVYISDRIRDRGYYFYSNGTIFGCINVHNYIYNDTGFCAQLNNISNTYIEKDIKALSTYPITEERLTDEGNMYKKIYTSGIISFKPIGNCTWNNKTYTKISFDIEYSNLTLEQVNKLGLNRQILPDIVHGEYCLDSDGIRLRKKLVWYKNNKAINNITVEVIKLNKNATYDMLPAPTYPIDNSTNLAEYKRRFIDAMNVYKKYIEAILSGNPSKDKEAGNMLANLAYEYHNPMFCDLLNEARVESCYLSLAAKIKNKNICKVAPDYIKDDCWIEIAYGKGDDKFCDNINNSSKRSKCMSLFSNITGVSNNTAIGVEANGVCPLNATGNTTNATGCNKYV